MLRIIVSAFVYLMFLILAGLIYLTLQIMTLSLAIGVAVLLLLTSTGICYYALRVLDATIFKGKTVQRSTAESDKMPPKRY